MKKIATSVILILFGANVYASSPSNLRVHCTYASGLKVRLIVDGVINVKKRLFSNVSVILNDEDSDGGVQGELTKVKGLVNEKRGTIVFRSIPMKIQNGSFLDSNFNFFNVQFPLKVLKGEKLDLKTDDRFDAMVSYRFSEHNENSFEAIAFNSCEFKVTE